MNLFKEWVEAARDAIDRKYYASSGELRPAPSLVKAVADAKTPDRPAFIAEIRAATGPRTRAPEGGQEALMSQYVEQGACALSVVTEPRTGAGSLALLRKAVQTRRPTIMRDVIVAETQIDCAAALGASAVWLIPALLPKRRLSVLVEYAHVADREVLVECLSREDVEATAETEADLVGINNRDPRGGPLDLGRTASLADGVSLDRPLVSIGGFASAADLRRVSGVADAVLEAPALLEKRRTVAELRGISQ